MKKLLFAFLIIITSITVVNAKTINFSVKGVRVIETSGDIEVSNPAFSNNSINAVSTFKEKDAYVIYSITLQNNDSEKYKLLRVEDNNTNEYIDVSYEADKEEINSKDTLTINVKIKYSNLLKNVDSKQLSGFSLSLVLEDEGGNSSEVIVNPNTSDNIGYYIVLLGVSILGLILIVKKYKAGLLLFIIPVVISPLIIFCEQEFKFNIKFENMTVIGDFDVFEIEIDNGNGLVETRNVRYGDTVGNLVTPTKNGYNFVGWYDENNNLVNSDTIITSGISIKAKFNKINYTITYNLDGGEANNVTTYTVEDEITLNNPTKVGYSFSGWTEGSDTTLRTSLTINRGSTGNKTFTAHFSANSNTIYHVKHMVMNLNGVYELALDEELSGTTDSQVTPQAKQLEGFKIPDEQTVTINGNGSTVVTYYYERNKYQFTINNRAYVETEFADGKYYYGTVIQLSAKNKAGYTFSKWSNDDTNSSTTITLTNNLTIEPIYKANTNTPYTVIHKKMKTDGQTYEVYEELHLTGTTDAEITPAVKTIYGFKSPAAKTVTISASGNTVVEYLYERNKYQLTINDRDYVETTFANGKYYYETPITAKAINRLGYSFDGWTNGVTNNTISFNLTEDTTIAPTYSVTNYTVTFNSMGGSSVSSVTRTYNQPVGELTMPEYENNNFLGWYTADGNTKISSSTPVTENVTYYAHWAKVICKKATSLHSETCFHDSSVNAATGCKNAGIAQNTTLTYGTLPNGNSPVAGDAYDCDINNDGEYNSTNERFYFIRQVGAGENSTYAFVFYNSIDNNGDISNTEIYPYEDGLTYFPDSTKWTTPGLVSFNGKVARYINRDDLSASCGTYTTAEGYLDACTYYLENTRYQSNTLGRSCIWIENTGTSRNRIDSRPRRITTGENSAVRPVIEIPYNAIDGYVAWNKYTINFDSQGGSEVASITKYENQKIGTLPIPTWNKHVFVGWYTSNNEHVTSDTIVTGNTTYYARWNSVSSDEIVNFNMTNDAMTEYFNNINMWKETEAVFKTLMEANFNNNNCSACTGPNYQDCPAPEAGKTLCDQPLGYNTGTNEPVKVYKSSEENKEKGTLVTYTTSNTGTIYNMIPDEVYYWELESDPTVYGYVKANGNRRNIYSSVRNVRDLGGLNATYTDDTGTHSGKLKYGVLYRGSRITNNNDVASLNKLGITEELDLRESNSDLRVGSTYKNKQIINYIFDRNNSDKAAFREAITTAMQDVVDGHSIYFHCKIGTDRTGTLAYFLEGLLGVSEEDKLEDYDLSYFYGLLNRHRFHDYLSGSSINPRFATMANTYKTNESIYNWYIDDPDNQASDIELVKQFRQAMVK